MPLKRSLTITDVAPAAKRSRKTAAAKYVKPKMAVTRYLYPGDNVHTHTRTFRLPALAPNNFTPNQALTDAGGVQATWRVNPVLGDLPNFTELSALYDEFRITECTVRIIPRYTDPVGAGDNNMLILGYFMDHNGAASGTYDIAENPWLERAGYRTCLLDKEVTIKFKPRPLQLNVNGTVNGTTSYNYAPWLSTGDSAVIHYGSAFRIYAPTATASFTSAMCSVYVTLKVDCRQAR